MYYAEYKLFINMERGINGSGICAGSMGGGSGDVFKYGYSISFSSSHCLTLSWDA